MPDKVIQLIPLKDIIIDPARFQFRQKIDDSLVREYSELMLSEVTFPPVTVFNTPEGYSLLLKNSLVILKPSMSIFTQPADKTLNKPQSTLFRSSI